jgi:Fe-S-cluster containining protein
LIVTVTGRDLAKLSQSLGLSAKELLRAVDFYILQKDESPPIGLRNIPSVRTERGLTYIALKKSSEGDCIFLKDNLCMIHTFRPSACESFPFIFDTHIDGVAWGLSSLKEICPGLGDGPEVLIGVLRELGISVIEGLKIYQEFVEDWNNNQEIPTALSLLETILQDSRFFV